MAEPRKKKMNASTSTSSLPYSEPEELKMKDRLSYHTVQDSLLSLESDYINYRGILNWSVVLLILTHVHLNLENFMTNGLLVDPIPIFSQFMKDPYNCPAVMLILVAYVVALPALLIEKSLKKGQLSEAFGYLFQYLFVIFLVVAPSLVVFHMPSISTGGSIAALLVYFILALKVHSYHEVNRWYRESLRLTFKGTHRRSGLEASPRKTRGQKKMVSYPGNIKLLDFYYFLLAPTLCYQLNFPRNIEIRKGFLFFRLLEMVVLFQLMLGLIQQWFSPMMQVHMKPLAEIEVMQLIAYLLKLSIPNHFIWLIFFYWFFHSCLNLIAELLCFGDRGFYLDWWNSEYLIHYWARWNTCMYKWTARHVFKPMVSQGFHQWQAQLAVYMISAAFYEYLIAVPLKMFRFWIFVGMMLQVPLAGLLRRLFTGSYANAIIWFCVILGQQLIVLTYFHDYFIQQQLSKAGWGVF